MSKKLSHYRHARHAGNRADVWKHAILSSAVFHLCARSDHLFRYFETHCGGPGYRLPGSGGEWHDGIGRVLSEDDDIEVLELCYFEQFGGDLGTRQAAIHGGSFYWSSWMQVAQLLERWGLPFRLRLADTSPEVAAQVKPMGVDFVRGDGFEELERLAGGQTLTFVDPPYGGDTSADWPRVETAVTKLARRPDAFFVWYPLYSEATARRVQELADATSTYGLEVVWDELPREPGEIMHGCGMLYGEHQRGLVESGSVFEELAEKLGGQLVRRAPTGARRLYLIES